MRMVQASRFTAAYVVDALAVLQIDSGTRRALVVQLQANGDQSKSNPDRDDYLSRIHLELQPDQGNQGKTGNWHEKMVLGQRWPLPL
jgi:hypothetical protein